LEIRPEAEHGVSASWSRAQRKAAVICFIAPRQEMPEPWMAKAKIARGVIKEGNEEYNNYSISN